jgi:hypothetical protein
MAFQDLKWHRLQPVFTGSKEQDVFVSFRILFLRNPGLADNRQGADVTNKED